MRLSLPKKVGISVGAAAGLMLLGNLVSYQTLADSRDAADKVRHSQEVLAKLESMLSRLLIAESESRAFMITRREHHLEAYQAALAILERQWAALQVLTADDPDQHGRLRALEPLLRQRLVALKNSVDATQANGVVFRPRPEQIRRDTELREEILRLTTALEEGEDAFAVQQSAVAEARARRATATVVGSDLLAALFLVVAGQRVMREFAGRRHSEHLLATQFAIVRVLTESGTLREAAAKLVQAVCDNAGWDAGALWLVDPNGGVLRCLADWHRPGVEAAGFGVLNRQTTFAPGVDLPGRVWVQGTPLWMGNYAQDRDLPRASAAAQAGLQGAFGFPVRLGEETLGVLDFFRRDRRPPADDLLQMLAAVGSQIGQFIARKRVEERLRQNEEKYRLLFERNPLPLWLIDPDSLAFLAVNDAAVRHYGYSREEFLALTNRDIRPPEDIPRLQATLAKLAQEQPSGPQYTGVWRHCKKDGTIIQVEITTDSFLHQGKTIRFVLAHDVTEEIRTLEALRQQRDFAESVIETAPAIVVLLDLEGRVVLCNSYLEELAGYRREEIQGRDWFTTFLTERDRPRLRDLYRQVLAGEEPLQGYINRIVTRDARECTIQWFSKKLKDEQGTVRAMLALGHDITELKQAQERALQAERLAAIGEMVTGLAHESRNALQRSQSCLKMLSWQVPDRPKALELIHRLETAQEHLQHLYEKVRSYAGPISLSPEPCQVGELVQETWDQLSDAREGRDAQLHLAPASVDGHCQVDRFTFGQVLRNILENALGACADPVVITVSWSEITLENRPALRLAIRDNGPGLSPDARQRIFEPFFTTKTHGTGLGMAIGKRIVEAHQGQISVGANGGPGAEILVTLPRELP